MFRFELEEGSKKYICPAAACSRKTFVRYVDNQTGGYLNNTVGRCDRISKCGYHYKPKEYFAVNPSAHKSRAYVGTRSRASVSNYASIGKNTIRGAYNGERAVKRADFIPNDYLFRTLTNYEKNAFVCFLLKLFPDKPEAVLKAVKDYCIGTTKDGKTIFWQIDNRRRVRTGKIIAYFASSGKRRKDIFPNWTHAELKKKNLLGADFNLKQCFFGEHLLRNRSGARAAAIVEAEKTAVIASICFPEFVWLAVGSKQSLKPDRLKRLGNRKIILYPDADGFALWRETADKAVSKGQSVVVSDLIETFTSDAEKREGFDLADYLIGEQIESLHRQKAFIEFYNRKLEKVLNDEKLFADFETILDEQKAVLIMDGGLKDSEAENVVCEAANLRQIVLSL